MLVEVIKDVAAKLGNKPATCKKYYVHPTVLECYSAGTLRDFADKLSHRKGNELYEHVVLSLLTPLKKPRSKKAA